MCETIFAVHCKRLVTSRDYYYLLLFYFSVLNIGAYRGQL